MGEIDVMSTSSEMRWKGIWTRFYYHSIRQKHTLHYTTLIKKYDHSLFYDSVCFTFFFSLLLHFSDAIQGEQGGKKSFSSVFMWFFKPFLLVLSATTVKTFVKSHVSQFILSSPPFSLLPCFYCFVNFICFVMFHFSKARIFLNMQKRKKRKNLRVPRMIADFFY